MKMTRRSVLTGAAVGGGLLVAWSFLPREYDNPIEPGLDETAFDAWIKIGSDGVVTVAVPQLEMGQGITTILPQIVAMELGADWRQIAVEPVPPSGAYANLPLAAHWTSLWEPALPSLAEEEDDLLLERWAQRERFTVTAEGSSLAAYELPCRQAAASARAMLCMAAADQWDIEWEECDAAGGFITYGEERFSFGDLALAAGSKSAPSVPPLRPELPPEIAQADYPRLDLPSKVDGTHLFAADVRLPDMAYAAIRHGPRDKSELVGYDLDMAASVQGLVGVVRGKRWLAAAADNWWAAEQALEAMNPQFAAENIVRTERLETALDHGVRRGAAHLVNSRGDGDEGYEPNIAARYDISPAVHATIETASVTARLSEGRLELWMASQAPEAARAAAAKSIGISISDVVLYPMPAGGSFDRRLDHDHAIEAALIAREIGRPVQLTWSRTEEQLALNPRTPAAGLIGAEVAPNGQIGSLRTRIACAPSALEYGKRLFENYTSWSAVEAVEGQGDPLSVAGADPIYGIPNVSIYHVPVELPLATGRMRGNAHGISCFMLESFIDEVAQRHGHEPMSYRISMLGSDALMADCLQRAARLAEWDGGRRGNGEGIACHRMQLGSRMGRIAVVATATAGEGGVRVRKLSAAVNIGRVINRDIALQQIESGLIFGLSLALGCSTEYNEGRPSNARLSALQLPTLSDTPDIDIELIESADDPFDPGEIGVPAVAPAIANALYSATGLRLRRLPLLSGGL